MVVIRMAKILAVKTIAAQTRKSMQALGVYKSEFEPIIYIYADMKRQYDILNERFEKTDYRFSVETVQGVKKAPIVTTLESLRKDLIAYCVQLGLTPAGLKKMKDAALDDKRPKSALERMLNETQ